MTNRFWTEEMKHFLIAHWRKDVKVQWIADQLGTSVNSVRVYASRNLGLGARDGDIEWVPPPERWCDEIRNVLAEVEIEWTPEEARRLEEVR